MRQAQTVNEALDAASGYLAKLHGSLSQRYEQSKADRQEYEHEGRVYGGDDPDVVIYADEMDGLLINLRGVISTLDAVKLVVAGGAA